MSRVTPSVPKYQMIVDRLRRDLVNGRYQPGQKFPSEAALVTRFGVSRITAGHAMRELQRLGLIDRIAGSGSYVRGPGAASSGNLLFGLIIPNLGETEIFEPICQAIAASPESEGHALLWPHAGNAAPDRGEQALQLAAQCISRDVAGVFFAPLELTGDSAEVNNQVLKQLQHAGIPVVLLDRRPEETASRTRCDLVGIDNHLAGRLATAHLLKLGARRIGFLRYGHQASTVKIRIAGYKDALGDEPARVFGVPVSDPFELSEAALACDAFVCANDRIAGRLMHYLIAKRVRVPRDVRIVGIDDVQYASLLPVPLTTIHQPCRDIGETALRLMLERREHPRMAARDVLLDCTLVVRRSCGSR